MKRDPTRSPHETGTAYNKGCRCDVCKNTHRTRLYKCHLLRKTLKDKSKLKHGRSGTYSNWGCRCAECTEAQRISCRNYYHKKRKINN